MTDKLSDTPTYTRVDREAQINEAARAEMLRADGARTLGENLEQADALIPLRLSWPAGSTARSVDGSARPRPG